MYVLQAHVENKLLWFYKLESEILYMMGSNNYLFEFVQNYIICGYNIYMIKSIKCLHKIMMLHHTISLRQSLNQQKYLFTKTHLPVFL